MQASERWRSTSSGATIWGKITVFINGSSGSTSGTWS